MVACGVIVNVFIDINSAVFRGMKMAEWYSFFIQFSKHFITVVLFLLLILSDEPESFLLVYLSSLVINGVLSFLVLIKSFNKFPKTDTSIVTKDDSLISILKRSREFFFYVHYYYNHGVD
jgi:O-antigen/teichoic acid export membrane protein